MTEEVPDVDAMLEQAMDTSSSAPANGDAVAEEYGPAAPNGDSKDKEVKKSDKKESSRRRSRSRSRSRDRKRKRSSSKDRKRSRSRSRDRRRRRSRSRSKDRRRRTRSPRRSRSPKRRSRSPRRRRSRTRSPIRRRTRSPVRRRSRSPYRPRRSRSPRRDRSPMRGGGRLPGPERRDVMPFTAKNSPPPDAKHDLSAEERDLRTVFILQIARSTRPSDLEDFFSSVGNVRDVRIITDSKTRRSKGISYVEFWEEESVNLALALNGQKLLNAPLVIQRTCAERNRAAAQPATVGGSLGFGPVAGSEGPVTLKVANLHPNITDSMLQGIFDPFGKIDELKLFMDMQGVSQGFAHVKFKYSEDAAKALEQLNGFELAGKTMKITTVDEGETQQRSLDSVTGDAGKGIALGQGGRMELMAKLAQSGGVVLPQATQDALAQQHDASIPAIATQCFMLSNMFDPATESEPGWADDVKEDVVEECHRNGGALHVYVDTASAQGNVYVKCPTVIAAHKSVQALHGRWFSGKVITANYVPVQSYHELFPEAMKSLTVLQPRPQVPAAAAPPPPPMAGIPPMMGAPPPPPMGYGGFPPPPQYGAGQGYYG